MKKRALKKPQKQFTADKEKYKIEELAAQFGKNKKLPRRYRLQALIALSFYPELADINIEFRFKETDTILSTKPVNSTVLHAPEKRKYIITISKKAKAEKEPVLLKNLTFNMQVGVIGHELAHILDYLKMNGAEVIKTGALYGLKKFRRKFERSIDGITVRRGLGYQLLEFSKYANQLKQKFPKEKYYSEYNEVYLSPAEIEARIAGLQRYK